MPQPYFFSPVVLYAESHTEDYFEKLASYAGKYSVSIITRHSFERATAEITFHRSHKTRRWIDTDYNHDPPKEHEREVTEPYKGLAIKFTEGDREGEAFTLIQEDSDPEDYGFCHESNFEDCKQHTFIYVYRKDNAFFRETLSLEALSHELVFRDSNTIVRSAIIWDCALEAPHVGCLLLYPWAESYTVYIFKRI